MTSPPAASFGGSFEPTASVFKLALAPGGLPVAAAGWALATPLPGVRAQVAAAGINSTLFAVGGLGAGPGRPGAVKDP